MADESIQSNLEMAVDEVREAQKNGKALHGEKFSLRTFNADGTPAFANLYRHFGQALSKELLGLEPELTGTLKEFAGEAIWEVLQYPTVQRMVGKYAVNMAKEDLTSLKCIGRHSSNSLIYQTV